MLGLRDFLIAGACTAAGAAAIPLFAQERTGTNSATVTASETSGQAQLMSQVLNSQVTLENGETVGTISDLVLGPQGNVLFAVGTSGDERFAVPFNAVDFNAEQQTAMLDLRPFAVRPVEHV